MKKELPKFEEVRHEMLPLMGFNNYLVHPQLGKIYSLYRNRWLLENAVGVGDKGYLQTALKSDDGKTVFVYEHQVVYAAVWGYGVNSWRSHGKDLEIDHIDNNPQNNCIENLQLVTSSQNKRKRIEFNRTRLTKANAEYVREEFSKWEGEKIVFYQMMADKFNCKKRTIQNAILKNTYLKK